MKWILVAILTLLSPAFAVSEITRTFGNYFLDKLSLVSIDCPDNFPNDICFEMEGEDPLSVVKRWDVYLSLANWSDVKPLRPWSRSEYGSYSRTYSVAGTRVFVFIGKKFGTVSDLDEPVTTAQVPAPKPAVSRPSNATSGLAYVRLIDVQIFFNGSLSQTAPRTYRLSLPSGGLELTADSRSAKLLDGTPVQLVGRPVVFEGSLYMAARDMEKMGCTILQADKSLLQINMSCGSTNNTIEFKAW